MTTAQSPELESGGEQVVRYASACRDRAAQMMEITHRYERRRDGRLVEERTFRSRLRYFFRYELEHLLARSGFTDVEFFGGFDGRPYDYVSGEMVVLARELRAES